MLEHLRDHPPGEPRSEEDERLLRVVVDQLAGASPMGSYLPTSDDPILVPVLRSLEAQPGDTRSLPELARESNTTERTLCGAASAILECPLPSGGKGSGW
ncbi:MAG TPA: hypothetical protein VFF81_02330 [Noviherbaspirillum sp.]|nr:hypothetical protein [Noviherbaspirillum sp.]